MMLLGGTHANLKIGEELKKAVLSAAEGNVRAVTVVIDSEQLTVGKTLPAGSSVTQDFADLCETLEENTACIVLMRLEGIDSDGNVAVPGATASDWGMLCWTPETAPVKQRMLNASSRQTLKDEKDFRGMEFKEYNMTERSEVTLKQFVEATREMTKGEKLDSMSQEERDREAVKQQIKKEQSTAPKMLAGLVALKVKARDSFLASVQTLLSGKVQDAAVLGKLVGDTSEELEGEIISDVSDTAKLKGRLPEAEPCYVLLHGRGASDGGEGQERMLLVCWAPEGVPVKLRMKVSTFKASVMELIKDLAPKHALHEMQATCDEDLDEAPPPPAAEEKEDGEAAGDGDGDEQPKKWKPPVGGMALPGLHGGGRPPPFASGAPMPGLGPKP